MEKPIESIDNLAFNALEKDYHATVAKLSSDESLEEIRLEYEKLYNAFKKSHKNEKRLIGKTEDLSNEIIQNAKKVSSTLKLSEDDQVQIMDLREEIKKAWKMVDAAHEKEVRQKDTIQELRKEIDSLAALVDKGAGLTADHEDQVKMLEEKQTTLAAQLRDKEKELQSHLETLRTLHEKKKAQAGKIKRQDTELKNLTQALLEKEQEHKRVDAANKAKADVVNLFEQRKAKVLELLEGANTKGSADAVVEHLRQSKCDPALVASLPSIYKKEPCDRTGFDLVALTGLRTTLEKQAAAAEVPMKAAQKVKPVSKEQALKKMKKEAGSLLRKEKEDEMKKKDYCVAEIDQNEKDTQAKTVVKNDLEAKIAKAKDTVTTDVPIMLKTMGWLKSQKKEL